eukprot:gene6094-5308_t
MMLLDGARHVGLLRLPALLFVGAQRGRAVRALADSALARGGGAERRDAAREQRTEADAERARGQTNLNAQREPQYEETTAQHQRRAAATATAAGAPAAAAPEKPAGWVCTQCIEPVRGHAHGIYCDREAQEGRTTAGQFVKKPPRVSYRDLRVLARSKGLSTEGTVADVRARLAAADAAQQGGAPPPQQTGQQGTAAAQLPHRAWRRPCARWPDGRRTGAPAP